MKKKRTPKVCKPYITKQGYWMYNGIHLHRVIASELRGRAIEPHEHVHHIDGNKLNNEDYNLIVCSRKEHRAFHRFPLPDTLVRTGTMGPWRPNYEF